jgi:Ca2+-transporting ATPase
MITGDHAATAEAIAREIGIEGRCVTGAQLDGMSDEQLQACLMQCAIFARVSPQHKVRLVRAYQERALIVAMTGDGVNDAPSIKAADIGIGMGTGTDVCKQAADMVLSDDNFATIVAAVAEGRGIHDNIKKSIRFLLSANIAEVLSLFIVAVFLRQPFLTPIMILLVNLITDSLPALALGLEKSQPGIMDRPPERSQLLSRRISTQIIVQGLILTALVMLSYIVAQQLSVHPRMWIAMVFVTLITVQLFHAYNCRADRHSLFASNPFGNLLLNISFVVGLLVVAAVIYVPTFATFFDLPTLSALEFVTAIGIAALIVPVVEIYKWIDRD